MFDDPYPAFQQRADACGQPITRILREAGVESSSWSRWRKGEQSPTLASLRRIDAVLTRFETERAAVRAQA